MKILTVDDSALSRKRFISTPLRESGYEVFEAVNGADGLVKFAEHNPDCVLTDLLMPVMDGFSFVEQLRKQGYKGPIIVLSADIQRTSRERIESLGISSFINKPFEAETLLREVNAALHSVLEAQTLNEEELRCH